MVLRRCLCCIYISGFGANDVLYIYIQVKVLFLCVPGSYYHARGSAEHGIQPCRLRDVLQEVYAFVMMRTDIEIRVYKTFLTQLQERVHPKFSFLYSGGSYTPGPDDYDQGYIQKQNQSTIL